MDYEDLHESSWKIDRWPNKNAVKITSQSDYSSKYSNKVRENNKNRDFEDNTWTVRETFSNTLRARFIGAKPEN